MLCILCSHHFHCSSLTFEMLLEVCQWREKYMHRL